MLAVEEVLNELGWADGFRIPIANEENKQLEEEVERKSTYKASLSVKLERLRNRVEAIAKHAENVLAEQEHNKRLIQAHSLQLDAEEHLFRTAESINSNLTQETREFQRERKVIAQRIARDESQIRKLATKLAASKKVARLDKERLLEWDEALAREEEDSRLIENYMKLDKKKFKELELRRQKLKGQLDRYRGAIVSAVNEAHEMEIVIDGTAKLYVKALRERRQLIRQWTQSVLMLRQRDAALEQLLREMENLREIAREKVQLLGEAEEFLESQISNNKQLERTIKRLEDKLVSLRADHRGLLEGIGGCALELETQKKVLKEFGRRVQRNQADAKQKKRQISTKRNKLEEWTKQVLDLKATLEDIEGQRFDLADRTKQLEDMIEKEEEHRTLINREANRLQGLALRSSQRLVDLEGQKKILDLQMQSERKKIQVLQAFRAREEQELESKREAVYNLDFEIQKCEMRLEHLVGMERDKEEVEKKQKTVEELEKVLREKTDVSKLLQSQIINLEHDMKKISNSLANDDVELQRLRNKKQDLTLLMDGGEKQLKNMQSINEEKQVAENILRLRVSQVEQVASTIGRKVYNLEKYKVQIEAAMQERKAEIKVQTESLNVQKRLVSNECSELRGAVAERNIRIQQLQRRYDNYVSTFGSTSDGSPLTATYFKVQSAQEKYLLQEQGDRLDERIRRTEQEIRSMENTLRIVNVCNEKYKLSLGTVDESGVERTEQKKLDEEMFNVLRKTRQKQAVLEEAAIDLKAMENNYSQLLDDLERTEKEKLEKQRHLDNLEKQIGEQKEKEFRADKSLHKVFKDIQNMCTCTDDRTLLLQEQDIAVRELQEQNGLALQRIMEFIIRHSESEPYVKKLLAEKNMILPCVNYLKPSPTASRCGSSASSLSSKRFFKSGSPADLTTFRESVGAIVNVVASFDDIISTTRSFSKLNARPEKRDEKSKGHNSSGTSSKHSTRKK